MSRYSAFADLGMSTVIQQLILEIQTIYQADKIPWVIGYSGGKDSTATLQLVWYALSQLPPEKRNKTVHVISTDTLVENPIVALWQESSLHRMRVEAERTNLPIVPHRLTPAVEDTFWVNLIGKGYPAPRQHFRWCTLRLKIMPSNTFIKNIVHEQGEAIVVLGTRKAESSARARSMLKREKQRYREHLSPNSTLPNSLVYSPIEAWGNDDVWTYLMQYENPWGVENHSLLAMYVGASEDGECPLVLDSDTPSCGESRFGCWVCTLVDQDKSMAAMIQNDEEKEWMLPLLNLREELDFRGDERKQREMARRDFRRMNGAIQYNKYTEGTIPGPYTQQARAEWLELLLKAQRWIEQHAPDEVVNYKIITKAELQEIRRIWVVEKHEFEDLLPGIFRKVMGRELDDSAQYNNLLFSQDDLNDLKEICEDDDLQYQTIRELLDIERRYKTSQRRAGLFDSLEKAIKKGSYTSPEDAAVLVRDRYTERAELDKMTQEDDMQGLNDFLHTIMGRETI